MSIGSLLSMRPTWLLQGHYSLVGNHNFEPHLLATAVANTLRMNPLVAQASVDVDNFGRINCRANGQKAYRFLPWREDHATYLELDAGAQLVLTGPVSACTVWAFEANGTTVLVHANANAQGNWANMTPQDRAANMTTKLNLVNGIKALYQDPQDTARLVYDATPGADGARTYEGYVGLVIGCKPRSGFSLNKVSWTANRGAAAAWTFYFYGYNGPNAANRVLWPL
jgi:hypothetical protein